MKQVRFAKLVFAAGVAILFALALTPRAFANVLGNPSFESELGSSLDKTWDSTNGATLATQASQPAFGAPPDGKNTLQLGPGQYTFQIYDNDSIKEGDFVTFSALAKSSFVAAGTAARLKVEFKKKLEDGSDAAISQLISANITQASAPWFGASFQRFTVEGVAPPGTSRVVFTVDTVTAGGAAGTIALIDLANGEVNPVKDFTVTASRNQVRIGEPIAVHAVFQNGAATPFTGTELVAGIPKGFSYVRNSIRVNGEKKEYRDGSLILSMGTIAPGAVVPVDFMLIPTSGVTPGKYYDFSFFVRDGTGTTISATSNFQVRVIADAVFDEGTILGKVFNDTNQNGVQDECEKGVPYAMLATEYGVTVVTDKDGKYHIPAVPPGRHVVKIDGHGLPPGTQFVTEEAYLVKTTPGMLNKANFAILLPPDTMPEAFKDDLVVNVSQGMDTSRPNLDVKMDQEVLRTGLEMLEKQPVFHFQINYPDMLKNWFIEVRDDLGQLVWAGFGVGAPPAEVMWNGKTDSGFIIKPGVYSYQFKVQDNKGREDWGPLHFFKVISKLKSGSQELSDIAFPEVGDFNLFKDGKRSIPLVAKPTVRVQGKTKPQNKLTVNGYPVEVHPETGDFKTEMYVQPGDKEFLVESTNPEGETLTYRKTITVKDSTFFMVGLGEEQLGYNFKGNGETVGGEDTLKKAFYENGRLSYYFRGKLKGKFLVKSRYDTSGTDTRDALFTNLDPERYYPVYGDASTISYEGQDTQDKMFVLVEMDKSFAKWGSFKTEFNDTELASYNRTLSGLKIDYSTVGSTAYGDPKRGFKLFYTKARQRAAHNEFLATGGSLYYLRNRLLIEGSEKIRVEVRDQVQNMAVQSTDLVEGQDYSINYEQGRIMLSRPLSSVTSSDTLSSISPLGGNAVYLVVDYEYDAGYGVIENKNRGVRGYAHMGDHVRMGATAVEETRPEGDYELRGVDLTSKWGRNTKVSLEYAEAANKQMNQNLSYNGGLSFADVQPIRGQHTEPHERAYLIKGESKPLKNLETSGYLQKVNGGFSNDHIRSQEGTNKYGLAARYKFTDSFYARYRFDKYDLAHDLRPPESNGVYTPYIVDQTHTAQLIYDDKTYLGQLEYQHRKPKYPMPEAYLPTLDTEYETGDIVAGKLGYRLNDRLLPYVRAQATIDRKSYYAGGGLEYRLLNNLFAYVEELFGNLGDATLFGLERVGRDGSRSYANLKMNDGGIGPKALTTTIGGSIPFTDKSRLYSEKEHSSYNSEDGYADILGYQGRMNDHWDYDFKLERRQLKASTTRWYAETAKLNYARARTFNTYSGALAYADGDKLRARTMLELRRDYDGPSLWQIVTREYLDYKFNQDLSYLAKLDYGISRFNGDFAFGNSTGSYNYSEGTPADFMEFSNGFAYRPVDCDKLNGLARYTYTRNLGNDLQYYYTDVTNSFSPRESAHIFATDIAYDWNRYFGTVEKFGYKIASLETSWMDEAVLHTILVGHRFNFHVTRKWDMILEYRALFQNSAADNFKTGPLVEVDREFFDYVRLGLGYNFTHFDDDLRKSASYDAHGPYVRMTGKF